MEDVHQWSQEHEPINLSNHKKVLDAFRDHRIDQSCFAGSSGYGYGDYGRDKLDELFASVFKAEDALVRAQLVSGTHTISVGLFGLLKPNQHLVSFTGTPYDTLQEVIGTSGDTVGSLLSWGVRYSEIKETLSLEEKISQLPLDTSLILIQRSRGYDWRSSISVEEIRKMVLAIKKKTPEALIFVDNCYGEFVMDKEPLELGADVIAGSLIKNPGGGLASTGGYLAGKKELIRRIATRFSAPGIGKDVGSVDGINLRLMYQGLYLAPHSVFEALKGAVYVASLMKQLGYKVSPGPKDQRADTVQAIQFNHSAELISFVQTIQKYSAIEAYVVPMPWAMPGYDDEVIMAAGTFVAGATSELTADAPLRRPYTVYLQGGLSFQYTKLAMDQILLHLLALNRK